jgi:peptidoglycan hydrolase CwlO-like protein
MKWFLLFLIVSGSSFAADRFGNMTAEDQKYYKNEYGAGMNQLERIDSTVKEINNLHGQIAAMKAEMQIMKKEIEELKKGK